MHPIEKAESHEAMQFVVACRELLRSKGHLADWQARTESQYGCGRAQSMIKSAVTAQSVSEGWTSGDGQIIADSFMQSLKGRSLLDAALQVGQQFPWGLGRVQLLSGATAGPVSQAAPKLATRVSLNSNTVTTSKIAAMIAMSDELAASNKGAAMRMFSLELRNAVVKASNAAFLGALSKTSAAAGSTTTESLSAGLAAAADADAYIVAVTRKQARDLALNRPNGSTLGVVGGVYVDGVTIIAVDGLAKMTVIPASRLAISDGGTQVLESGQATIELDSAPTGTAGSTQVSLWQSNMSAILVERLFAVANTTSAVEVG